MHPPGRVRPSPMKNRHLFRHRGWALTVAFGPWMAGTLHAQSDEVTAVGSFPEKPIRIIVPTAAGGGNDFMGRYIARKLSERLSKQVIVDNRPGAAGLIGSQLTASAQPDGYTLLMASSAFSMVAAIQKLSFHPINSFSMVSLVSNSPSAISVSPTLPVTSIGELIGLARRRPGELRYASAGTGSFNHFSGELFKLAAKADIVHVPYKGGPPGIADVMAGHIEVLSSTLPAAIPHIRSKRLKGLGVGSMNPSPAMPTLPPIALSLPGYESVIWWGLIAPAGVPGPIIQKLNGNTRAILASPETKKDFENQAAEPVSETPEAFRKMLATDLTKWAAVAKANQIRSD
jgi:tripartite-type tricarboxylate transporter receptor subunit TctC